MREIPVPDMSGSKHPGGVPMLTHGIGARYDEYIYRQKWLELHKKADVIVVDELTKLPVRAEYKYWAIDENPAQNKETI